MAKSKKPANEPVPVELASVDYGDLQDKLSRKYGRGALQRASDIPDLFALRRPTGIPSLDLLLHGGLPSGGITEIIGEDGAGKTDLAWRVLSQAQKNYGPLYSSAMVCVEHIPDLAQARMAGLDVELSREELQRLRQTSPELSKSEIQDLTRFRGTLFPYPEGSDGSADAVLDFVAELYASRQFQIIVLDSLAAIEPRAILDLSLSEDGRRAAKASVVTRFMAKIWNECRRTDDQGRTNETTLLVLQQYREDMGKGELRIGGGRALRHGKLISIELKKGAQLVAEGDVMGRDAADKYKPYGRHIVARILKGKAGISDGGKCEWDFVHGKGIDLDAVLVGMALFYSDQLEAHGFEFKGGGNYTFPDGTKVRGVEAFTREIPRFRDTLLPLFYAFENVPYFRVTG